MKAEEFDKLFDSGADISQYVDYSKARRINQVQKRVNVDFPVWMINSLDKAARKVGVTRQSVIKMWIAEKIESQNV